MEPSLHAPNLPAAIGVMTRRLIAGFQPDRIVLFGSYARGTAEPDSDADLLVVIPIHGSSRQLAAEMERTLAGSGLPKDLVLVTPEQMQRQRDLPGTLVYEALREGVVLYERS